MGWKEWKNRLRAHLKDAGLTQDDVAERLEVTQGTIAHWLKGRREINLTDFFALCEAAQADPQAILFGGADAASVMRAIKTMLDDNPALQKLIARPSASAERVSAYLQPAPKAPAVTRPKVSAMRRRKRGS